jgi:5'-methylthioadenosine phosphorylase
MTAASGSGNGPRIGIIGGSGLYDLEGLVDRYEQTVDTPFGAPSSPLMHGRLGDTSLVFLARHGRGHVRSPTSVPYRANIWALKSVGVDWVISVSAVGSLKEAIEPGHVCVVDQFIDRTKGRAATFFEDGIVAHISFGDPLCPALRGYLLEAAHAEQATVHDGGIYLAMEGPAFSTRAESNLYRSWGADVIGMTNLPEAKLAREAEMSYATLAMSTDYDCWHPEHGSVTVEQVIDVLMKNVSLAKRIIARAVPLIAAHDGPHPAHRALKNAILTSPDAVDAAARERVDLLVRKYLG